MSKAEGEEVKDRPELVVDDPEDYSQNTRIQQILKERQWVMQSTHDIKIDPRLSREEKERAIYNDIWTYIADLEPLKDLYPACEGYWTGNEADLADNDTQLSNIGEIDYVKRARAKRAAIRRHEMKGVRFSVSNTGIDILNIQPSGRTIGGLSDFVELNEAEEVTIEYRQQPSAYNTDPEKKRTVFEVSVPIEISRNALRMANLYLADIGLTATPGEEETDAVGRYSDLMEHGPPEGDPASVRGDDD